MASPSPVAEELRLCLPCPSSPSTQGKPVWQAWVQFLCGTATAARPCLQGHPQHCPSPTLRPSGAASGAAGPNWHLTAPSSLPGKWLWELPVPAKLQTAPNIQAWAPLLFTPGCPRVTWALQAPLAPQVRDRSQPQGPGCSSTEGGRHWVRSGAEPQRLLGWGRKDILGTRSHFLAKKGKKLIKILWKIHLGGAALPG